MTRSLPVAALLALALACQLDPGGRCTGDADCQPGLRCGDAGLCVVEAGKDLGASCELSQDCVAWGACQQNVCVLAAGSCVVSSDCAPWATCTDHACVPNPAKCVWDTDCAAWQVCRSNACTSAPGRCDTPTAKTDCPSWQTCDATNHACVTAAGRCAADADCKALQTCMATHVCASAVVLWGNLGVSGRDAVSQLATPSLPSVAFGPASLDARIDPTGVLVYRDGTAPQTLRKFVPDDGALAWDATNATWVYPAAPFSNDGVIGTPNCSAAGTIDRWTMAGAGAVLHSCTKGFWYDSTGAQAFAEPAGYDLVAWSTSDAKLLAVEGGTGFLLMDKTGVEKPVDLAGAMAYSSAFVRVNDKDFWLALFDATGAGELWSVAATGAATIIAAYPPAPVLTEPDPDNRPNPLVPAGPVVIDAAGAAYGVMSPSISPSKAWKAGLKVVKRVAGTAASTVVYDAGNKPTGANTWTSQAAPRWWVLPSGPMLVTGP
jgi:hypothetical protein